jgi:ubiquinone/menaquinone biosynthesis C-methylase UbiE
LSDRHLCPVWLGYFLASPLRRLFENPDRILSPHLASGMLAMDLGCAMGFYSLPMAEMVGAEGHVVCIDLQERMIRSLYRRAKKTGLQSRMELRVCSETDLNVLDLEGSVDFALASAVVHEVPDPGRFFSQVQGTLKPEGELIVIEPGSHVSAARFENTLRTAEERGLKLVESRRMGSRRMALFMNSVAERRERN